MQQPASAASAQQGGDEVAGWRTESPEVCKGLQQMRRQMALLGSAGVPAPESGAAEGLDAQPSPRHAEASPDPSRAAQRQRYKSPDLLSPLPVARLEEGLPVARLEEGPVEAGAKAKMVVRYDTSSPEEKAFKKNDAREEIISLQQPQQRQPPCPQEQHAAAAPSTGEERDAQMQGMRAPGLALPLSSLAWMRHGVEALMCGHTCTRDVCMWQCLCSLRARVRLYSSRTTAQRQAPRASYIFRQRRPSRVP